MQHWKKQPAAQRFSPSCLLWQKAEGNIARIMHFEQVSLKFLDAKFIDKVRFKRSSKASKKEKKTKLSCLRYFDAASFIWERKCFNEGSHINAMKKHIEFKGISHLHKSKHSHISAGCQALTLCRILKEWVKEFGKMSFAGCQTLSSFSVRFYCAIHGSLFGWRSLSF